MSSPSHGPLEGPNPYAPPQAPLGDPGEELAGSPDDATRAQRFANFLVDRLVLYGASKVFSELIVMAGLTALIATRPRALVATLILNVGYFVLLEGLTGRTLGKLVTGTRVVDESGGAPGLGQIVGRSFMRFVPFEPISFFGSVPKGWHDTASHTRVVSIPAWWERSDGHDAGNGAE